MIFLPFAIVLVKQLKVWFWSSLNWLKESQILNGT